MSNSILQSFLDNQFIKTDETSHIDSLKKASGAVQRMLENKKNKLKIISYTLVALDPTISDDNPVILEVEEVIIKQWPTFRNSVVKTKDAPITYVQATILEALNKLSKNENLAAIIWHTGCNIVNHYKLAGQEEVITNFLLKIGNNIEEVSQNSWGILGNTKIGSIDGIEFNLPSVPQEHINETKIINHLKAGSIHTSWGQGGENTFTANQGNVNWPSFFSERAGKGLSEEINVALSTQNKSIKLIFNSIHEFITSYFESLKLHLEQVSSSILQNSQSLNKRSDLLWWKQTLYSQKLNLGYRKLEPLTMVVVMAVDLANKVSPIYPKSVDYFLEETLRDVLKDKIDTSITLEELVKKLQLFSNSEKSLLKDLCNEDENRKSLGACMADVLDDKIDSDELAKRIGVEKNTNITLGELIVWLFHDIQANTLINVK